MAEALAEAGASVVLVGRRTSALSEVEDGIAGRGGSCASVSADLADRQELVAAAERCADIFGEPDILVNAAGLTTDRRLGPSPWRTGTQRWG
jgi:gluconate 5-dehydrogenase